MPASKEPDPTAASAAEAVAVALTYERGNDPAPKVSATGRGAVAAQILEIAYANGVVVREDADLAEVLAEIDVDSVILLPAFAAVAEILAYLYRLNGTTQPNRSAP